MKKLIYLIFLTAFVLTINPEVLRFKYILNSKQRIEATIKGKQLQNNALVNEYLQQYKTIRTIKAIDSSFALLEDDYYFYNKNQLSNSKKILELGDEETIYYNIDQYGKTLVNKYNIFPTLRNIPGFPEQDVRPGDTWTMPGFEAQDIFNDRKISIFPVSVNYTYLDNEKMNNKDVAKIKYEYEINIKNSDQNDFDPRIKKIEGKSSTVMYFDYKSGVRVKEEYLRDYAFLISAENGNAVVVEFIDNGERNWSDIERMDKNKVVDDLKKQLEKEKVADASVKQDDKGVKISLENLHFKADSSELLPEEIERLNKVSTILKNYKNKGILIIGHTTDKGTEKARLKLSIDRAKSIADFLIEKDAINVLKSSFGGKGGTEPIADNSTEDGMKKNRRAEIYILEE